MLNKISRRKHSVYCYQRNTTILMEKRKRWRWVCKQQHHTSTGWMTLIIYTYTYIIYNHFLTLSSSWLIGTSSGLLYCEIGSGTSQNTHCAYIGGANKPNYMHFNDVRITTVKVDKARCQCVLECMPLCVPWRLYDSAPVNVTWALRKPDYMLDNIQGKTVDVANECRQDYA